MRGSLACNMEGMGTKTLGAIGRPDSLATLAYQEIRKAIRDGTLVQDRLYSEKELAELMGISRTPVREALIEFSRERLIEIVPKRGFRLRRPSAQEIQEVFELRAALESLVLRHLAKDPQPDDIAALRDLLDEQRDAIDDPAAFLAIDEQFHLLLPALAKLRHTEQLLSTVRGILWLSGGVALAAPHRHPDVLAEHTRIVDAIEAGDGEAAVMALREHLDSTQQAIAETSETAEQVT